MKKTYIFIYSDLLGTFETVKSCLDNMNIVLDWRTDLPNTFYLVSESNAEALANEIRARLGNHRFLITEYSNNSQGWLNEESWHLLNNSTRKPGA
jgi:hypothetical protein